jgi:hypothetical protein
MQKILKNSTTCVRYEELKNVCQIKSGYPAKTVNFLTEDSFSDKPHVLRNQ